MKDTIENGAPRRPDGKETSMLQELLFLVGKIMLLSVIVLLVFGFLFGFFRNRDPSMAPGVKEGDLVLYYRLDKDYTSSDLALVEYQGEKQVRRVVAVAGDTVDITEEGLLINGALQQEPGIYTETLPYQEGITFPITIGEGQVFLLGDNREYGADSRLYGPVEVRDTLGKVITILRRRNL